eukprot:749242-Hanusia_phi.AAC.4
MKRILPSRWPCGGGEGAKNHEHGLCSWQQVHRTSLAALHKGEFLAETLRVFSAVPSLRSNTLMRLLLSMKPDRAGKFAGELPDFEEARRGPGTSYGALLDDSWERAVVKSIWVSLLSEGFFLLKASSKERGCDPAARSPPPLTHLRHNMQRPLLAAIERFENLRRLSRGRCFNSDLPRNLGFAYQSLFSQLKDSAHFNSSLALVEQAVVSSFSGCLAREQR